MFFAMRNRKTLVTANSAEFVALGTQLMMLNWTHCNDHGKERTRLPDMTCAGMTKVTRS